MDRKGAPRPPLLVVAGPTASGKTELAVELALALGAEIVGADSMQVYRGLDIGTAKPGGGELRGVAHHLVDVADPTEPFDAARYAALADAAIADVAARGRRVVVAGGTGLYIRTLLHGLHGAPAPEPALRASLTERARAEGPPALHRELVALDPKTAARLHPNDGVRIVRALEVALATGVPISDWQARHGFAQSRYDALLARLERPRAELHRRIELRVTRMMAEGFLTEVRGLLAAGYGPELRPMQGLGYKRLCQHLAGELSLDDAVAKITSDTKRFARRQRTWFASEPKMEPVSPDAADLFLRAARFFEERERGRS
ncbi:MAG: tRNA (adenosine(37)-N6)-dimethylallyltransferase MiaA [Deltaproteobacteria bacterium]|nr:tRNA (adenosine(37)-N6)-dimethylallyltransferase MiaA [Deltaproteobacteria bacterium]